MTENPTCERDLPALPPILPDLFQALDASGQRQGLVGAHCSSCGKHFFPAPDVCPDCLGPVQRCVFGERGRIYSFTVVRTRAPFGLPEPYGVGYVDLDDVPLRVFALFDPAALERLDIGAAVVLKAMPLGRNRSGGACLRPVYCLVGDTSEESQP